MKKIIFVSVGVMIFAITGCTNQDMTACIDSCKATLASVCTDDQTKTCETVCVNENEELRNCLIGVDVCEDLDKQATLCFSKPEFKDPIVQKEEEKSYEPTCPSVCQKYSTCAGFGEDVTEADKKDAYDSCMVECPKWSPAGLSCMDEKEIKAPADCMQLSVCGAQEYDKLLN